LIEFPILIQTNILANHLLISGTGDSAEETSGLKMVAVEIVEIAFDKELLDIQHCVTMLNPTAFLPSPCCLFCATSCGQHKLPDRILDKSCNEFAHTAHAQIFCEMQSRLYSCLPSSLIVNHMNASKQ
jgi:hypothetical protein